MARFTLDQTTALLPLVKAVAKEIVERRTARRHLVRSRDVLEAAQLTGSQASEQRPSLAALDARIIEHDEGLARSQQELESFGLTILRLNPLTIHFPGHTRTGNVVFCWQENEETVCHGHAVGEEEEPRRPLKVKVIDLPGS